MEYTSHRILTLARLFHIHEGVATATTVAQVSKPAVSPTSKSATRRSGMRVRRFEAPSYGRFGNLRHLPWREISGLALLLAAASCPAETNSLSVVQDTLGHLDAKLTRQANELLWFQRLADIAVVDKVRFTGPPPRSTNNVAPASGSNHVVISAFTFLPRQRSRDRSRPLIVLAHGEIHGNVATDEDFHVVRELVQQGYAVIAPDYRGSSGYGADFWHQIDYGGLEIEDVHAARQFMLDRYRQIDPRRVGIIGWSHGGAIALLTVFAHPGDYAACYAGAPVSDLEERIRIRGETYGQLLAAPYHLGKTVAEAPDEYRRRSPAWNVEKLRTPLLLHANTNDEDVTIGEVERLIRALQAAQKGFDWRIYTNAPGGHYFNRLDTSLALESRAEIWRFLAKHLRPPHPAANRIGCLPTTGRNTVLDFGDSPQQCRGRV